MNRNRVWILSLDKAHLLVLLPQPDTGFDKKDCDGLVQLAFFRAIQKARKMPSFSALQKTWHGPDASWMLSPVPTAAKPKSTAVIVDWMARSHEPRTRRY